MKNSFSLSIVIVNYNPGNKIVGCLRSLQLAKIPPGWQARIIVLDNGSIDDSIKQVKHLKIKELQVIKNSKNLGFAAAANIGIKMGLKNNAHAILLLNQDAQVEKRFFLRLAKNKADIISPVIKFLKKGVWKYDYGGRVNLLIGRTSHFEKSTYFIQKKESRQIDYVSGCAMFIRRKVFEKIGLFDERFFLYFEDVDLCLRARKAGFSLAVEPKAVANHHLIPTKDKSLWQNSLLLKSNLLFINKHVALFARPLAYLYWTILFFKVLTRIF